MADSCQGSNGGMPGRDVTTISYLTIANAKMVSKTRGLKNAPHCA